MDVLTVVIFGIICAFFALILKQYKPEFSLIITILGSVIILIVIVSYITPIISEIRKLMQSASIDLRYISILIKGVGICFVTQFASDTCKDAGQISLSSKIELVGRVAICLSALPLYKDLLSLTQSIIGNIN